MDVKDPHEHHWFTEPTKEVGPKYVVGLVFAQLVFFIALLGPAIIGIGVKVQAVVPDDQKTSAIGHRRRFRGAVRRHRQRVVRPAVRPHHLPLGSASPLDRGRHDRDDGRLRDHGPRSDRSGASRPAGAWRSSARTRRWRRSSPPSPTRCRSSSAAASPPCSASRRTSASSAAPIVAQLFADQLVILFVVPSIFAIGAMLLFAFILPDQHLTVKPPRMTVRGVGHHVLAEPAQVPRLRVRLVVPVPDHPGHLHVHHLPAVLPAGRAGSVGGRCARPRSPSAC